MIKKFIALFQQDTNAEFYAKLEAESKERRARNAERIAKIKEDMGELWVMHESHKKGRLDTPRPV